MVQTVAAAQLRTAKDIPCPPFRRVRSDDLVAHWDFVEKGLSECVANCGPQPWTIDQARDALLDGRLALYVHRDGFVILQQAEEPVSRRRYLNVWAMWFPPNFGRRARAETVLWLDAMKAANGCNWIAFTSSRAGWACMQPQFREISTNWVRP